MYSYTYSHYCYHPIAITRKSYPVKEQCAVEADVMDTLHPSVGCVAPSL